MRSRRPTLIFPFLLGEAPPPPQPPAAPRRFEAAKETNIAPSIAALPRFPSRLWNLSRAIALLTTARLFAASTGIGRRQEAVTWEASLAFPTLRISNRS